MHKSESSTQCVPSLELGSFLHQLFKANPMKILLLLSILRLGNWGRPGLGTMPKTTKLVSGTNIRRTRFVLSEACAFLTTKADPWLWSQTAWFWMQISPGIRLCLSLLIYTMAVRDLHQSWERNERICVKHLEEYLILSKWNASCHYYYREHLAHEFLLYIATLICMCVCVCVCLDIFMKWW